MFGLSNHNYHPISLVLDCPMTLQSSRSLDTLSDLKLQRLEAELEGARHEAQGACQREEELKAECERLREELRELQSNQRQRVSNTDTHPYRLTFELHIVKIDFLPEGRSLRL